LPVAPTKVLEYSCPWAAEEQEDDMGYSGSEVSRKLSVETVPHISQA